MKLHHIVLLSTLVIFGFQTGCQSTAVRDPASSAWPLKASDVQHTKFLEWAAAKKHEIAQNPPDKEGTNTYYLPKIRKDLAEAPNSTQSKMIQDTANLYFNTIGRDTASSFIWTGIESGNPRTHDNEDRWDSLDESGLNSPAIRQKLIKTLKDLGIKNLRLGISNHLIDAETEASWAKEDAIIDDFYKAGFRISLDLNHFGIEDRFQRFDSKGIVKAKGIDGLRSDCVLGRADNEACQAIENSFYQNPDWPKYFGEFAYQAYKRYHSKIFAVTLINEPQTVQGFNSEQWHGGYPGWSPPPEIQAQIDREWQGQLAKLKAAGSTEYPPQIIYWPHERLKNSIEIRRAINVARAAVMARTRIEQFIKENPGTRRVILHTEAMVAKWPQEWKEFNPFVRFLASDTILGDDWFLAPHSLDRLRWSTVAALGEPWSDWQAGKTPATEITVLNWMMDQYIFQQPLENREAVRQDLYKRLAELADLHHKLQSTYGVTMKSYTIFGADYYCQNEPHAQDGGNLQQEPQYYKAQVEKNDRAGFYNILIDYWNRYKLPVAVTETGTPIWPMAMHWNTQMLLEAAQIAKTGIPFLAFTMYPALDTRGWGSALAKHRNDPTNEYDYSGFMPYQDIQEVIDADGHTTPRAAFSPRPFVSEILGSVVSKMPEKAAQ